MSLIAADQNSGGSRSRHLDAGLSVTAAGCVQYLLRYLEQTLHSETYAYYIIPSRATRLLTIILRDRICAMRFSQARIVIILRSE